MERSRPPLKTTGWLSVFDWCTERPQAAGARSRVGAAYLACTSRPTRGRAPRRPRAPHPSLPSGPPPLRSCTKHKTDCAFAVSDLTTQSGNFSTLLFFPYFTVLVRTTPEAGPMAHREGASFKPRPLGSHVAVRDGPSPARLTHCLAGVDYRPEDYHHRAQHLQPPHRRWFSSCCGLFAAGGVALLQVMDHRRSWVLPFKLVTVARSRCRCALLRACRPGT